MASRDANCPVTSGSSWPSRSLSSPIASDPSPSIAASAPSGSGVSGTIQCVAAGAVAARTAGGHRGARGLDGESASDSDGTLSSIAYRVLGASVVLRTRPVAAIFP